MKEKSELLFNKKGKEIKECSKLNWLCRKKNKDKKKRPSKKNNSKSSSKRKKKDFKSNKKSLDKKRNIFTSYPQVSCKKKNCKS